MNNCMITFRSVTPAQRAEGLLRRAGLHCALQRTPRWMEEQGCGYSLRMNCQEITQALDLLRARDIPFRKAYLAREGGKMEELAL